MTSTLKKGIGKGLEKVTNAKQTADGSEQGGIDPREASKYLLRVTAGPSYDPSTHKIVRVNGSTPFSVENQFMSIEGAVRIKDYHGLPKDSPSTHPYFSHPDHTSDRYSISFSFVPKQPIRGEDVVMGFDFDHSIRDRLPPGFKAAMHIVTTILDPGIYSDPYSDKPYLYGPALSSFFVLRVGDTGRGSNAVTANGAGTRNDEVVVQEGADGNGAQVREQHGMPEKAEKRRKHFLKRDHLEAFTFEKGRMYHADFFNPYLDFANFALRLPGFSLSIAKYIDEKTHQLRYVLKNRRTGDVYLVVVFTLLLGQALQDALNQDDVD